MSTNPAPGTRLHADSSEISKHAAQTHRWQLLSLSVHCWQGQGGRGGKGSWQARRDAGRKRQGRGKLSDFRSKEEKAVTSAFPGGGQSGEASDARAGHGEARAGRCDVVFLTCSGGRCPWKRPPPRQSAELGEAKCPQGTTLVQGSWPRRRESGEFHLSIPTKETGFVPVELGRTASHQGDAVSPVSPRSPSDLLGVWQGAGSASRGEREPQAGLDCQRHAPW